MSRRAGRALFGVAAVLCSSVVLPLSQAASESRWSQVWVVAPAAIAAVAFAVVALSPWLAAAPLRRLYREQQRSRPNAVVSIVEVLLGDAQSETSGVLIADEQRVSLLGLKVGELTIEWGEVESITRAFPSIEKVLMVTSGPHGSMYLTLLKSNGIQSLPGWQLEDQLKKITRLHHSSKNAT